MSKSKTTSGVKSKTISEILKPYEDLLDKLPDEKPLKAKLFETPLGQLFAVSNEKYVVFLIFAESRHFDREMKHLLKVHSRAIIEDGDVKPLQTLGTEIKAYFSGELNEFDTPFEINQNESEFQRSVWDEIRKIGYGKTTTFADVAKRIGKPSGAQPVANACSRNPLSLIIPCHRIMSASKGKVGNNSCIERRDWLLNHEKKFA